MVNYLSQLWCSFSMHYNEKESLIIQSFNPQFNWFHIFKRILFIIVDFSILITYIERTNSIWGYLSLYSYGAVSIHLASTVFLITGSIIRCVGFYKYGLYKFKLKDFKEDKVENKPKKDKEINSNLNNFKYALLFFDMVGGILLVISILQLTISSVSFWICMKFDWGYGYPTIVSHYVVIFLALFEFFTCIIYMHWWGLVWSLFYAGIYYSFSILVFFVYGYWIYDFQDPKKFSAWILLTVIVIISQFIVYFALFFLNLLKTKIYIYINQHYFKAPLYDEHTQLNTLDDYYHNDLLLWGISIFVIQLVQLLFSIFGTLILAAGAVLYPVIVVQSIFFFINVLHAAITIIASKSIHIYGPEHLKERINATTITPHPNRIIKDAFYFNLFIFFLNIVKMMLCIIFFAVFSFDKVVWLFYGIGLFTLMDFYLNFYIYELYEFCFPKEDELRKNIISEFDNYQSKKMFSLYKGGFSYLKFG